jgi:hypothetical protein
LRSISDKYSKYHEIAGELVALPGIEPGFED